MTALVFGFIRAGSDGWRDGLTIGAFAASLVLLAAFVAIEARVRQPIVPLRLFTDRDRAAAYLTMPLYVSGMFGAFFFLTQYLQEVLGYGPLRAGVAFLPMVGMQFTVLRILPKVLPRFGARPFVLTGAILVGLGLLWLSQVSADSGYVSGLLGPFLLMGTGGGIAIMPLNMTVLAGVPAEDAGAASGVAQAVIWLGASLGSAVLVTVFGAATRHATGSASHVMVHGLDVVFASAAGFALAALLVVLVALRPQRG
jgi:predicted MFS family arabinose efflux permease